ERRAFDDHEADDPPPGEAARSELVRRQPGKVIGEARRPDHVITGSGSRVRLLGQNHAVRAITTGIVPTTTAHGEKIEQMNSTAVATDAMNGHRLGSGIGSRR